MYLPSTTPSQRAFNAKRDIARGNIEGEPMAIAKLAGIELAKLREEKEALTAQVFSLRSEAEAKLQQLDRLKAEAFDLRAKIDRYKITLADFADENGPTMDGIKKVVAKAYGVSTRELKSKRRVKSETRPRHIAMYLCKALTGHSFPAIGRSFGGRDHTTIMHAYSKIANERLKNRSLDDELKSLASIITEHAG